MKKNKKKWIAILVIFLIIVVVLIAFIRNRKNDAIKKETKQEENTAIEEFVQVLDDGTKLNRSTKLNEAKEINGLKVENIQLTEQNSQTVLLADVTNNSENATDTTILDITLLDKNGAELITVKGMVIPLQAGASTQLNASMTLDYSNAYDFKLAISK